MKKLWNRISNLGVDTDSYDLIVRANRLTNQVNLVLLLVVTIFNIMVLGVILINEGGSFLDFPPRLVFLQAALLTNIWFASKKNLTMVKVFLIAGPVLIGIVIPTLLGLAITSSFFYYHLGVLGFSIIPAIVLVPIREPIPYWISLIGFGIILLLLDDWMLTYTPKIEDIKPLLFNYRAYMKLIPFGIFCFLQGALYYLHKMNVDFETLLRKSNNELENNLKDVHQMQSQMVQSEKMASLGTMVAGVAHEINNPLNYISGGLALVSKELSSMAKEKEEQMIHDGLSMMKEGVARASHIVKSMKSFTYQGSTVKEPIDVGATIDDCLLFLSHNASEDVTIEKDYQLSTQIEVFVEKFQHIIINILDNSLFALRSSSRKIIKISSSLSVVDQTTYGVVKIFNSGPPIPEDVLPKIFDPFYTTKDPGVGTGLGLSISYSHVLEHNGTLEANNTENGVEFVMMLPINV